jgi:CelD/BcsL family acetyltransferase involved in cellulose biosynthesis
MLEWSVTQGLHAFDFGYGDEAYKDEYCDVSTPLYRMEIPSSAKGRVYSGISNVRRRVERIGF